MNEFTEEDMKEFERLTKELGPKGVIIFRALAARLEAGEVIMVTEEPTVKQ